MKRTDGMTTSSTLLRRLGNPADATAWLDLLVRYLPLLRLWCRRAGLDHHAAEEVTQIVLIELSSKMRDFRYDPSGSFRGWLWTLCRNRIIDSVRKQQKEESTIRVFRDISINALQEVYDKTELPEADADDACLLSLLRDAERVQEAVRKRVDPKTWDAFVLIEFKASRIQDAADALGMKYAATYAAHARVLRMLREEGSRLRDTPSGREE